MPFFPGISAWAGGKSELVKPGQGASNRKIAGCFTLVRLVPLGTAWYRVEFFSEKQDETLNLELRTSNPEP
jgi:hypothetical protein